MTNELQNLRAKIDSLDTELLRLLAKRTGIVKDIGALKKAEGVATLDEKRWKEMLESRLALAKKFNVSPEFVKELFELIHQHSLEIEQH